MLAHGWKLALLGVLLLSPAAAAPEAVDARVARALADPARRAADRASDAARKPGEVLTFLGLRPGQRVLDILASPGGHAEIMARVVGPRGRVVAYDPPQFVASKAAQQNWADRKQRLGNISQFLQPLDRRRLPPRQFDLVLMHLAYHETYWESRKYGLARLEPAAFLRTVHAAMKPGGAVGVIDHIAPPGPDTRAIVDRVHRIDPAVVRRDFEKAGFVFDGATEVLRNPEDDRSKSVFDRSVRNRTDRFVYRFRKP